MRPNAPDSVAQSSLSLARPELDTDKLELELPTIPMLPVNTQATKTAQLESNVTNDDVVNGMLSSITTYSQGTFQYTIVNINPSLSRYLLEYSSSTTEFEVLKTESWKRKKTLFRSNDNTGSTSLKPYLTSTSSISPTPFHISMQSISSFLACLMSNRQQGFLSIKAVQDSDLLSRSKLKSRFYACEFCSSVCVNYFYICECA